MKNKIYKLLFIFVVVFSFSSCQKVPNPIEDNKFNVEFKDINFENNTAVFEVFGYPNESERSQLENIIIDSLKNQNVKTKMKVSIYSDLQNLKGDPFYGEVTYEKGQIDPEIKIPLDEEYLELARS